MSATGAEGLRKRSSYVRSSTSPTLASTPASGQPLSFDSSSRFSSSSSNGGANSVVLKSGMDSSSATVSLLFPAKIAGMVGSKLSQLAEYMTPQLTPLSKAEALPGEFTLGPRALPKTYCKEAFDDDEEEMSSGGESKSRNLVKACRGAYQNSYQVAVQSASSGVQQSESPPYATPRTQAGSISRVPSPPQKINLVPAATWDIALRLASAYKNENAAISLASVATLLREMGRNQPGNDLIKRAATYPVKEAGSLELELLETATAGAIIVRGRLDSTGKPEVILVPPNSLAGYKVVRDADLKNCPVVRDINLERDDVVVLVSR